MKAEYSDWISKNYPTVDSAAYQCSDATKLLVKAFPELIRVRGWYGFVEHWWCETADGEIVDPTAIQFPSGGVYKEFQEGVDEEPIGKCMNCGDYCWKSRGASRFACSGDCASKLVIEYDCAV